VAAPQSIRIIPVKGTPTVNFVRTIPLAATRKQFKDLAVAAIHAALRKRVGVTVVSEGSPAKSRLKEAAN
jgi:hypothetical protein